MIQQTKPHGESAKEHDGSDRRKKGQADRHKRIGI
jgi:hypothetical protein